MTLRLEGKDETFEVTADFVLDCLQDLNDFCWDVIVTSGRTVMLRSCDYKELQPGRCKWFNKDTQQEEEWYPREIYCESMHLSFPKTNVPFAAMIYNAKTMRSAKENEVKDILTWLCCFMDGEAAWEKRKNSLSKDALKRPMNQAIHEMVVTSQERTSRLKPSVLGRCKY